MEDYNDGDRHDIVEVEPAAEELRECELEEAGGRDDPGESYKHT